GRERKYDVTPTNGITYTFEFQDFSVKVLGAYGKTTRLPDPAYRLPVWTTFNDSYTPGGSQLTQWENIYLRPEHTRGYSGGVELFYGNLGSFTVNYYRQTVDDLIQRLF